jgi:hypothetical protein
VRKLAIRCAACLLRSAAICLLQGPVVACNDDCPLAIRLGGHAQLAMDHGSAVVSGLQPCVEEQSKLIKLEPLVKEESAAGPLRRVLC